MSNGDKSYLGDGVYARDHGHVIQVTTENGISIQNEIIFEHEVLESFIEFVAKARNLDINVTRKIQEKTDEKI